MKRRINVITRADPGRIDLKKVTQAELADRIGINRSQISSIIKYAHLASGELTRILGENPFQMTGAELKKCLKAKK